MAQQTAIELPPTARAGPEEARSASLTTVARNAQQGSLGRLGRRSEAAPEDEEF